MLYRTKCRVNARAGHLRSKRTKVALIMKSSKVQRSLKGQKDKGHKWATGTNVEAVTANYAEVKKMVMTRAYRLLGADNPLVMNCAAFR